jgi:hypothetical protein
MKRTILIAGLFLSASATAEAQEAGQVGIVAASSASIGAIWHISDSVAVRPEVGFSIASSDDEFSADSKGVSVGGSVLFYVSKWEQVRAT